VHYQSFSEQISFRHPPMSLKNFKVVLDCMLLPLFFLAIAGLLGLILPIGQERRFKIHHDPPSSFLQTANRPPFCRL